MEVIKIWVEHLNVKDDVEEYTEEDGFPSYDTLPKVQE